MLTRMFGQWKSASSRLWCIWRHQNDVVSDGALALARSIVDKMLSEMPLWRMTWFLQVERFGEGANHPRGRWMTTSSHELREEWILSVLENTKVTIDWILSSLRILYWCSLYANDTPFHIVIDEKYELSECTTLENKYVQWYTKHACQCDGNDRRLSTSVHLHACQCNASDHRDMVVTRMCALI